MNIFDVLSLVGGLALFLFGMDTLGKGLEKLSGGRMERRLEKLTSNRIKAVALGTIVTAIIQSSSATTVMVVGFVNSGIMKLSQAIGIIMGANIGTTMTSWILSLSSMEGDSFIIRMLKPSSFSPILAIVGVALLMFSKKEKKRHIGEILIGFAVLMTGMDTMSAAVKPLQEVPTFTNLLLKFSHPVLGLLAGLILTAIIQSSSASVGILQALCTTGALSYGTAIPIIMGQNIGTCVTAIISSIGTSKNAKRAAAVHLFFNIIGTAVFMLVFYGINVFAPFDFLTDVCAAKDIAVIHSLFNIGATCLLLPFSQLLEKLAIVVIRDSKEDTEKDTMFKTLDDRFLDTPGIALEQCKKLTDDMAKLTKAALFEAMALLEDSEKKISFSKAATAELAVYTKAIKDILNMTVEAFEYEDVAVAKKIEPLEEVIDELNLRIKKRHINRLCSGECTMELGFILHDILANYERVSDHCSNVALAVIQTGDYEVEAHRYISHLKAEDEFKCSMECVKKEYVLPEI